MRYYPVFLDIKGKRIVVIGGGVVAERKVESLLKAGASITVISPRITKRLLELSEKDAILLIKRNFRKGDLAREDPVAVVSAAKPAINRAVSEEAKGLKTIVNVVDDPALCDYIVPSVVDRGDLIIAVSTSGKAPALSKKIRLDLERRIGEEYAAFTAIIGAVRNQLLKKGANYDKKERVIKALIDSPIPEWITGGAQGARRIDSFLKELLGASCTLAGLGVDLKAAARRAEKK